MAGNKFPSQLVSVRFIGFERWVNIQYISFREIKEKRSEYIA
jgi:hypothetical protein